MSVYRHVSTLLSQTEAVNAAKTGASYVIISDESDTVNDTQQGFKAFFDVTQDGGATSPTTNAQVQTSHDGVNWVAVTNATQLAGNGAVHELKDIAALGPYVRAISTLAGGTLPNHTIVVKLASNGPFRLVVVG